MAERARPLALVAALALGGCYVDPAALQAEEVLALELVAPAPVADGASSLEVRLRFAPEATPGVLVALRASAGVFGAGAPLEGGVAVRIPAGSVDAERTLGVPLEVPRAVGPLRVEAEVGGVVVAAQVALEPALPDRIVADQDRGALVADGQSRARLGFALERAVGRPSLGVRLAFAVCCADASGAPRACPIRPPLRVPTSLRLSEAQPDDRLEIEAVTEPADPQDSLLPQQVFLVVAEPRAQADLRPARCAPLSDPAVAVPLRLTPPAEDEPPP